jgi:NAD(P)-dependent dehydrogenase (short-subunit alcohol dehydrogenase family)
MVIDIQYDFSGQTAIVTGGGRGIGRAVATTLVRFGAQVWIWDIDPVELDGAHSLTVDVTRGDQIAKALADTVSQSARVDILVNNAGYLGRYQTFEQFDAGEWQRILQVNLIGVFEVTRRVLPIMRLAGRGRVVNMGSLAGKEGLPSLAVYSAASAGVIAFTKALAREVCDTDIRVNCVAPGPIDTELIRGLGKEVVDAMITASPLRRLGSVDEVAGMVLWLCSAASAFLTPVRYSTCRVVARGIEFETVQDGDKSAIPGTLLTDSDLSSHAIDQLLGIVADPGLKHRLDVLDLVNSF